MESPPPRRKHTEILTSALALQGKTLADIGCGKGNLSHYAARKGAQAIGLDCSEAALRQGQEASDETGAAFVAGVGEALPFGNQSLDIVLFFNSLHHVPEKKIESSLQEAARVLKPGGRLYVAEPLAEGPHFTLVRAVEDETGVRAAAYRALCALRDQAQWSEVAETLYTAQVFYPSFEAFCRQLVLVDASRRSTVEGLKSVLAERFAQLGTESEKGWAFDQPMRVNLFTLNA